VDLFEKAYIPDINELAQKLLNVLLELSPGSDVPVTQLMTNFTFETIGKLGFGYDFGLLASSKVQTHPFIEAINFCLREVLTRMIRGQFWKKLPIKNNKKFEQAILLMQSTVEEVSCKERFLSPCFFIFYPFFRTEIHYLYHRP